MAREISRTKALLLRIGNNVSWSAVRAMSSSRVRVCSTSRRSSSISSTSLLAASRTLGVNSSSGMPRREAEATGIVRPAGEASRAEAPPREAARRPVRLGRPDFPTFISSAKPDITTHSQWGEIGTKWSTRKAAESAFFPRAWPYNAALPPAVGLTRPITPAEAPPRMTAQKPASKPVVGIIMGSRSDWPTLQAAGAILDELGVRYEAQIVSAHRTPERLYDYAKSAKSRGLKAII